MKMLCWASVETVWAFVADTDAQHQAPLPLRDKVMAELDSS